MMSTVCYSVTIGLIHRYNHDYACYTCNTAIETAGLAGVLGTPLQHATPCIVQAWLPILNIQYSVQGTNPSMIGLV